MRGIAGGSHRKEYEAARFGERARGASTVTVQSMAQASKQHLSHRLAKRQGLDLELIGPRIDAEGYASAVPRAVDRLGSMLADLGA